MAAQSLIDAITMALSLSKPKTKPQDRLTGELRDFFAHQIMLEADKYRLQDGQYIKADADQVLLAFFNRIFKDHPALKKDDKKDGDK
jgi:hypothetical protein